MPIRVVIADDHSVVRQGLRMVLALDPELEVVGEAADGTEALTLARRLHPDVVLMDLLMPVMSGIAATEAIRRELPDTEVLALTSVLDNASVADAVRAGAIGYLLKTMDADELCRAIKAAAAGTTALSPEAADLLMRGVRLPDALPVLTERERDVLGLLAHGLTNKEIGRALGIGEKTVKSHKQHPGQAGRAEPHPGRALRRAVRHRRQTRTMNDEKGPRGSVHRSSFTIPHRPVRRYGRA
jgi:DNA-binding NarL/FixJ family response regulator